MSDANVFMHHAIELASIKMRNNEGGPFGAVIVRDAKIIGEGWNRVTSTNDPTANAEIVAIRHACATVKSFMLTDCDIYTNCEPCPMCLGAIYWARLRTVYYSSTRIDAQRIGFDDDFIYRELALPPNARQIPLKQIISKKAEMLFHEWMIKADKTPY